MVLKIDKIVLKIIFVQLLDSHLHFIGSVVIFANLNFFQVQTTRKKRTST